MTLDEVMPPARGASNPYDARPEVQFDEIATLAGTLCRTPMSMVLLLDEQNHWSRVSGIMRLGEIALSATFCDLVSENTGPTIIEDALRDPLMANDPQITGPAQLRFLAGVPVYGADGSVSGVLCVSDRSPRVLTSDQEHGLELLAHQLTHYFTVLDQRRVADDLRRERERSVTSLKASEELFRTFMNASPFLSYLKDAAGRLLFYNHSYARRFGISDYAWLGRTDEQLWDRHIDFPSPVNDRDIMSGGRMVESEERLRGTDGAVTCWKTYKFPCHDSSGNLLLAGLAMDITEETERKQELERFHDEMQQANEQLRRLSVTDELTGLRNRRAFEERLVLEFSMSRRRRRELAVLLLDVDNFKKINDRWGHAAGDIVLRRLSAILRTTVRLPDLVARYGGEEFVVLLPESSIEAGQGFARRLLERIRIEPWEQGPVTISIGLAALNDSLLNGFQLVSMADEALYAAKRAGKDRVVTYGSEHSS